MRHTPCGCIAPCRHVQFAKWFVNSYKVSNYAVGAVIDRSSFAPQRVLRCGLQQNRGCQQRRAEVSPPYAEGGIFAPNLKLCVGRGALTPPRILHRLPYNAVGVLIERPPSAPQRPWLPLWGSWHGEAVTEGVLAPQRALQCGLQQNRKCHPGGLR